MDTIFLLVEHGREQGEVYVLGWFDDEKTAKDTAEAMEWKTYREEIKRQGQWSSQGPLSPAETVHRRFWVKQIAKFGHTFTQKSAAVH
jgi:hypothetical protein